MWKKSFQAPWNKYSFEGYCQRWPFELQEIDKLVQQKTNGKVKIFSWGSNRSGTLMRKIQFNYRNNDDYKSHDKSHDIEWKPILTEKTYDEVAVLFVTLAKEKNATHICISGVSEGWFQDDTFLFIMFDERMIK